MVTNGRSSAPATQAGPTRGYLSLFNLVMLTIVAVVSLRSLPTMATYGMGSITLYVIPALLFLVPTALVAAELATGWKGGVYVWVREAMGNRWGFQAIWLQWVQNVVWYPVQLAFVAASLAYMLARPGLSNSGYFTAAVILIFYWGSTLLTLRGGGLFAKVGSWGGVIGTLIPGALLIVLGIFWFASGEHSQVPVKADDVIPPFTGLASIVLIVSNFLGYAGMEVNAVHANDMREPRQYPKAILISSIGILVLFILPTIAIAAVVPSSQLSLTSGVNVAFQVYFDHLHVSWLTVVLSAMIAIGGLASVVAWIAGPSKGLLAAARTGLLPPVMQKRNSADVQVSILVAQGFVVTVLAGIFVIIPNVSAAFFTLVDMAAALYLIMYMLMFASAIILRRKAPDVVRSYRVPAMTLIASVGFLASASAFVLSFVPPQGLAGIPGSAYPWVLVAVIVVLGAPPLVFYALRKPGWDLRTPEEKAATSTGVLVNPPTSAGPTDARTGGGAP